MTYRAKAPDNLPAPIKTLVDLGTAAGRLGCSTRTVRRAVADGRLQGYRSGRSIRVALEEVDALYAPIKAGR
jgi:excisionase family DNA binding protein